MFSKHFASNLFLKIFWSVLFFDMVGFIYILNMLFFSSSFTFWSSKIASCSIGNYRVPHGKVDILKQLWQIETCKLDFVWRYLYISKVGELEFHQFWIFDDSFHKKGPLLVILMPLMIKPSGSGSFLRK